MPSLTRKNSSYLMATDFAFLIILIVVASGYPSEASPIYEVCWTSSCLKSALTVSEFLNTSADPCENFYQYACGGWIDKNPIPDDRVSYMTYEVLRDKVSGRIGDLLRDLDDETHSRSVYDAASLYKGCMNKEAREAKGLDPLRSAISEIGGWPIAEPEWNDADYTWYKRIPQIIRDLSYTPVIGIGVDVDANETSQHLIYIVQPSFGLGRNQLVDSTSSQNEEIISAYKDFIMSTAKMLNPNASEAQLERDASDLITFEQNLARFTKPSEEKRSAKYWYNKMTVKEVQRTTENDLFQWRDFLNDVFRDFPEITDETKVLLTDGNYTRNAIQLAKNTNPRILANYIGWNTIAGLAFHTTEEFKLIRFRFDKVLTGIQKPGDLGRSCTNLVIRLMGFAAGRLYVDNYFTEAEKADVEDLVEDVRSAYRVTLENAEWMDKNTKSKALQKLNSVEKLMGYPSWILNDDELNKYYETARGLDSDEFFVSVLKATKSRLDSIFGKWKKPANRTLEWRTNPAVVNAYYDPSANTITFPAGILDDPYYQYGRATALNFGALGGVIGHELSHGFDDQGSEYGPKGNLINWWTDEIREKFNEKADCFREQYSSYVEPTTNMRLNGNNSVGENIADNGAVRNSFLAFKMHSVQTEMRGLETGHRLPGITATADQLFFIGRAMTYCGSERKEILALKIQYETHTPSEFRVVVPLTNSKDFADAFDCPLGSPMNPEHKCLLW